MLQEAYVSVLLQLSAQEGLACRHACEEQEQNQKFMLYGAVTGSSVSKGSLRRLL